MSSKTMATGTTDSVVCGDRSEPADGGWRPSSRPPTVEATRVIECGWPTTASPDGGDRRGDVARRPTIAAACDDHRRANVGCRHGRASQRDSPATPIGSAPSPSRPTARRSPPARTTARFACGTRRPASGCSQSPEFEHAVAAVSFHPNGQQLAVVGFCNTLEIINTSSGQIDAAARLPVGGRAGGRLLARRRCGWRSPVATARFACGT